MRRTTRKASRNAKVDVEQLAHGILEEALAVYEDEFL
jgi:hypothetical protein